MSFLYSCDWCDRPSAVAKRLYPIVPDGWYRIHDPEQGHLVACSDTCRDHIVRMLGQLKDLPEPASKNPDPPEHTLGLRNHRAKLSLEDVAHIRRLAGIRTHKAIARMFKISASHVGHIIRGARRHRKQI